MHQTFASTEESLERVDSAVELPVPAPLGRLSLYLRLSKGPYHVRHPKTLHELVGSTCAASCAIILRRSKLSAGVNLLVTDPMVVDLLLTCVSSVDHNVRYTSLNLIPGCPVSCLKVREAINDLPTLAALVETTVDTPTSTPTTISSTSTSTWTDAATMLSGLPSKHQELLTWLTKSPFSHLSSMTPATNPLLAFRTLEDLGIKAFVVTRQPPNKEARFQYYANKHSAIPVFHGTHPSRLPRILSQGLKNMSGSRYQVNGKVKGRGIYLSANIGTSLCYAHGADAWTGSTMVGDTSNGYGRQVRILLGCELAAEGEVSDVYIIKNEARVIVRFVFVVPDVYVREPGMEALEELRAALNALRDMRGI